MSYLPTPNYVVMEQVRISKNGFDEKILEPGSFVRPIHDTYLPSHIKESVSYKWHSPETECFCYTGFGIVLIEKSKLRKV